MQFIWIYENFQHLFCDMLIYAQIVKQLSDFLLDLLCTRQIKFCVCIYIVLLRLTGPQ